ncbi:MAG TPA: toll/interleukin-1 receptor domain-containing protein [Polyangiaceae bacterium]|nr:toll/interleukin-1 receptor domain-containing protein [Polyangiaceae bacterium]
MYDVFVSYSSNDRPWAKLVADELTNRGFNVFFDAARLEAGKAWEPQLKAAVQAARHMVVVWSKNAKDSDWVSRERVTFDVLHGDQDRGEHRLIVLALDDAPSAYSSLQSIRDLLPDYAAGATALPPATLRGVIDKLDQAVRRQDGAIPIPLVVLTLTAGDLAQFDDGDWKALTQLGVSKADLSARYGATREDWKPFGGDATIKDLLSALQADMNKAARDELGGGQPVQFRWEPVGTEFWSDSQAARAHAKRFSAAQVSLVVLDAVALIQREAFQRLLFFQDLLTNRKTATLVVPPFPADQRYVQLQKWLDERGAPYFDPYFRPLSTLQRLLSAQCGLGSGDTEEMRRRLLVTVGQFVAENKAVTQPVYMRVGT